jgi:hypothetical protein
MKTFTRDDTEHGTEYVLRSEAEAAIQEAVAATLERCAKLCDLHARLTWNDDRKAQSRVLAAEIRRGEATAPGRPLDVRRTKNKATRRWPCMRGSLTHSR